MKTEIDDRSAEFFKRLGVPPQDQWTAEWGWVGPISLGRNPRQRCSAEPKAWMDYTSAPDPLWGSKCSVGVLPGKDVCGTHDASRRQLRSDRRSWPAPMDINNPQDQIILFRLALTRALDWEPVWLIATKVPYWTHP